MVILAVTVWASVEPAVAEDGGGIVLHVDDDATPGGDGLAWETAYKYLQDALAYAFFHPEVDEIRVAQGMYFPDRSDALPEGSGARNVSFDMLNGLSLNGGYRGCPGGDCTDAGDRDVEAFETILSGEIGDLEVTTDNSYHVVVGTGTDATAVIDGFTITAGRADGSAPHDDGAGLYVNGGSPVVAYCEFADNYAEDGAGMFYVGTGQSCTLEGCTFLNNTSTKSYGGAWIGTCDIVTITGCAFLGNAAGEFGGGLCIGDSTVAYVADCTFSDNASQQGGGLRVIDSVPLELTICTFEGNTVHTTNTDLGTGGGVYCAGVGASYCVFTNNSATSEGNAGNSGRGGGIRATELAEVSNCEFTGNTATGTGSYGDDKGLGGAVFSRDLNATDCTFTGNGAYAGGYGAERCGRGGAVFTQLDAILLHCTFNENEAQYWWDNPYDRNAEGGGICANTIDAMDCEFIGNSVYHGGEYGAKGGAAWAVSMVLDDCTFENNSAESNTVNGGYGGALFVNDGHTTVSNCVFDDNSAMLVGGGIYTYDASDTIHSCAFTRNDALEQGGGAIYRYSPDEDHGSVRDCYFYLNTCGGAGGALRQQGASLDIENCTFERNSSGGSGGALFHDSTCEYITACYFIDNDAGVHGGAVLLGDGCSPLISRCLFHYNETAEYGGGLACFDGSSPTVANCLLVYNNAGMGGGATYCFNNSNASCHNATFAFNTAGEYGGAVYNDNCAVQLCNCILWDDEAPSWPEIYGMQTIINYSDVEGGWPGTNNMNEDPLFGDGGRLLADSPCIDAGDPDFVESYPGETDVHGLVRVWDGDDDGDWIVDMGACEFGSYPYGDCNCDGAVTFDDILPFIRALDGELTYYSHYPDCRRLNADANGDGAVTFDDIQPFVGLFE